MKHILQEKWEVVSCHDDWDRHEWSVKTADLFNPVTICTVMEWEIANEIVTSHNNRMEG